MTYFMLWSHLHVKRSRKATKGDFHEIEWSMAILWQLQGECGTFWVYMAVTGCTWHPPSKPHIDPVSTMRWPRPMPYHENYLMWLIKDGCTWYEDLYDFTMALILLIKNQKLTSFINTSPNTVLPVGNRFLMRIWRPSYKLKHNLQSVETVYNKILGTGHFVCYIRYFVISVVNKQYKIKQFD